MAVEMIAKEGFDGLSMQKLAKKAGVSPATIYIYFKDRDDLIYQISLIEGRKMTEATLIGFDPDAPFAEGLRCQWINRANYFIENPIALQFLEQIRNSPYHEKCYKIDSTFIEAMKKFVMNAINRNELMRLPLEVYWSVAFAPLYQLVRFHLSPRSIGMNEKFFFNNEMMDLTLSLVLKALKP